MDNGRYSRRNTSFVLADRVGTGVLDGRHTTLLGRFYDSTRTCGAGTDDSCLSRTLVPMARGGYFEYCVMDSRRRLLYGGAVRFLVR